MEVVVLDSLRICGCIFPLIVNYSHSQAGVCWLVIIFTLPETYQ